jgi:nitrite reductase/ring-hydroxylating ferredoxin subunit/uncharacterized membrane protein
MGAEQIARKLGDQEWLDGVAEPVQSAIRNAFKSGGTLGQQTKDFLHGSALGHPLHPALIELPVGAWTLVAIFDALELVTGNESGKTADKAIAVGLAGAVGAAVAGATDWSETDGRAKRIGLTHGLLNLAAAGLYGTSLLLRKRARSKAIGVANMAFGIVMFSAFLGGHLAYGEQIGVDHTATADQGKPDEFTPVLDDAQLPDNKPVKVLANDIAIVLVRQGPSIFALRETCAHLGGPLSEGTIEGDSIRCPWHGSRFCLKDGSVREGPAIFPERVFEVRVREGRIEVRAPKEQ